MSEEGCHSIGVKLIPLERSWVNVNRDDGFCFAETEVIIFERVCEVRCTVAIFQTAGDVQLKDACGM